MTALPAWLAGYAALDDDTLAVLANRGLLRRGVKEAVHVELAAADESSVRVRYTGTPPAEVTLLPGGPRQALCSCPVAGVCVHIVAACLWTRAVASSEPVPEAEQVVPMASRGVLDSGSALKAAVKLAVLSAGIALTADVLVHHQKPVEATNP